MLHQIVADSENRPVLYNPGDTGVWSPIPELRRSDADVSIFIISANSVYYYDAVSDPLFAANVIVTAGPYTFHRANQFYNVLGCVEKYQVCSTPPSGTSCTQANSRDAVYAESHHIGLNPAQLVAAELFLNISFYGSTSTSAFGLGAASLLANDQVADDQISASLPDNQWQLEASNLFALSLARLQAAVPVFTSKSEFSTGQYVAPPTQDQQRYICHNQKIRNIGGYQSFTAAAVWIIIGAGLLILVLASTIDSCFEFIQKRRQWKYYKVVQWKTDSKFQQQRIAMSSSGKGTWTGADESIPVTLRGEVLAVPKRGPGDALVY